MSDRLQVTGGAWETVGLSRGLFALVCWLTAVPAGAQEVIELPAEDRRLEPVFEEVYRVGSLSGEDWEQFGNVRMVGFDGAGQLYIFDSQADRIFVVSSATESSCALSVARETARASSGVPMHSRSCGTGGW